MATNGASDLVLSGIGSSPYALRGLSETLQPIEASSQMRRTVNGGLTDISLPQFQKYRVTISSRDQLPPALDGVFPGQALTVDCISELSYLTSGGSPAKTVVAGSSRVEGDYTFYRPQLSVLVVGFQKRTDEFGAEVGWSLELEEV